MLGDTGFPTFTMHDYIYFQEKPPSTDILSRLEWRGDNDANQSNSPIDDDWFKRLMRDW